VLKFTIDTNCLIDVAERNARPNAPFVLELYRQHLAKNIDLAITGVAASENQLGGVLITNFDEFLNRIVSLGLSDLKILKPVLYWGVTFWGWSVWGSQEAQILEKKIHDIVHPNCTFSYPEFCEENGIDPVAPIDKKWRNRKCDVLTVLTHILEKRDVFVTSDTDIVGEPRNSLLCNLGAKKIVSPSTAVTLIGL
jgi:hypothetical protein